jgi:glutamate--cysteine ligase
VSTPAAARVTALRDGVFARSFAPAPDTRGVGAEVELLAYDASTNRPLPLLGSQRSVIPLLRQHAAGHRWNEVGGDGTVPRFVTPHGAAITFEPGGQIEVSSPPCTSAGALVRMLDDIVSPLRARLGDHGVRVDSVGIDPYNEAHSIPQQLPVERYRRMTEYFETIGPFGIRMMRQTAAIQISVDRGANPSVRWRLLNDLAPYLVAIFANSPWYDGRDTGHRSYRAHCWRMLDATRTGMAVEHHDPALAYTEFALGANDLLRRDSNGLYAPAGQWPEGPDFDLRWQQHLTTLFPEVRPRGHYEVRSCDAIDPSLYAVPIVLLCGLAYDERAAREARVLATESRALLSTAGHVGLGDAALARTARDLFQLAIDGARRLGTAYISGADVELAEQFRADYTARTRSPADDTAGVLGADPHRALQIIARL